MQNWAKTLLTVPFGVVIVDVFGYVARVDGESMKPTLNPNVNDTEYVFLNKLKAKSYLVKRGDVVCLISPKDPKQRIIKRVIAIQGDTIDTCGYKEKIIKVPNGHLWIEGDYQANSLDSNTFGPVPLGLLTAKATHVVWPLNRWRLLDPIHPNLRKPLRIGLKSNLG